MPDWIPTAEAADLLDVSRQRVAALIKERRLRRRKDRGSPNKLRWLVNRSDVERYDSERRNGGRA